jgi:hypothetical protein
MAINDDIEYDEEKLPLWGGINNSASTSYRRPFVLNFFSLCHSEKIDNDDYAKNQTWLEYFEILFSTHSAAIGLGFTFNGLGELLIMMLKKGNIKFTGMEYLTTGITGGFIGGLTGELAVTAVTVTYNTLNKKLPFIGLAADGTESEFTKVQRHKGQISMMVGTVGGGFFGTAANCYLSRDSSISPSHALFLVLFLLFLSLLISLLSSLLAKGRSYEMTDREFNRSYRGP